MVTQTLPLVRRSEDDRVRFSVVIPTYNRFESLLRCLASFAAQEEPPPFEVIVVDDASTDGTEDAISNLHTQVPLKVLRTERNGGPAAARNLGLESAEGDYVLFVDDDVIAQPQLLARHGEAHRLADGIVVIGPMLTPSEAKMSSWVRWESYELEKQYEGMVSGRFDPSPRQFYTANASVALDGVRAAGGFDVTFRRAEDIELGFRLAGQGLRFAYEPGAAVTHYPRRSLRAWWVIPHQYGVADIRMWREKEQPYITKTIAREFQGRNRMVRQAVRIFSQGRTRSRTSAGSLVAAGVLLGGVGLFGLARRAYSLAYNILYYGGVNEELASPSRFREIVRPGRDAAAQSGLSSAQDA